jgi:hypothetical protein
MRPRTHGLATDTSNQAHENAEEQAWVRVPRGIALATLLAVPFWAGLAIWLLW